MPIRISGSTGISGLDGSATTPVLQGASANSGIYYSGNTVFVSTSGTNAMTIGPTGNVAFANSSVSIGGQTISAYSGMMKNRIINGDMRIDQRFAGAANNNIASNQYVVDRWRSQGSSAAKLRFQQNNTNGPGTTATQAATGFLNYFGANTVSSNTVNAGDYWFFAQDIEGLNTVDLNWGTSIAAPVTLSFWSYSSIAGTHGGSLRNYYANRSFPFTYTINTANTWQFQTITIPGDTTGNWLSNNNVGISVFIGMGLGSNYTSTSNNTWQTGSYLSATGTVSPVSSANGSLYFTGVQLEKGSQATPFEFRHYTTELSLCQRYFYKEIPTAVNTYFGGCGLFYNTTSLLVSRAYPVTMRAIPAFIQSGTASHYGIQYAGGSQTCNAVPALNGGSIDSSWVTFYGTGFTAGQAGFGFNTGANQGYLAFSSELLVQN